MEEKKKKRGVKEFLLLYVICIVVLFGLISVIELTLKISEQELLPRLLAVVGIALITNVIAWGMFNKVITFLGTSFVTLLSFVSLYTILEMIINGLEIYNFLYLSFIVLCVVLLPKWIC